ncbi:MAG TPA: phosphoribosylaminoimidazolesuccinocarboxamide synthase, partial [Candidatus Dormibacteraeota bacterium]|nr:phosphoribosylaminoimidazolesuccinocarboxamide synthase [Candidatus Dormibacteraeota bacterium]
MMQGAVLTEGKTKVIRQDSENPGEVLIESKDDITAGDGVKRDQLEGKARASTVTTSNCFELLEAHGIPTHFRGQLDEWTFRARNVEMIPLELVARRIATGSYLKRRPDVVEGTIFPDVMVEFFEKDDPNHDPLLVLDLASRRLLRFVASKPLAEGFMAEQSLAESQFADLTGPMILTLIEITEHVFTTLEEAWAQQDVALVDLKIECGRDAETGELVVADVIDNDSWRIWPGGDKSAMKDKQVYRDLADTDDPKAKAKELGKIKENYQWVAEATGAFAGARSS